MSSVPRHVDDIAAAAEIAVGAQDVAPALTLIVLAARVAGDRRGGAARGLTVPLTVSDAMRQFMAIVAVVSPPFTCSVPALIAGGADSCCRRVSMVVPVPICGTGRPLSVPVKLKVSLRLIDSVEVAN